MTVTVTQTRSEFARNTLRIFFYRGMGRFLLLLAAGMILFSLVRLVLTLFGYGEPGVYVLVAGIGLLTLLPALIYRKASMTYESNPAINQPMTYTFTEEGIETSGPNIASKLHWEQLDTVAEIRQAIFIYYTNTIANPIPKHNFTEEQLEQLRALVEAAPVKGDMA